MVKVLVNMQCSVELHVSVSQMVNSNIA